MTVADLTTAEHEHASFLRCHTFGHAWFDADSDWKTDLGTPWTLRCERCGTERREVIGSSGRLVSRHYHYPDGYRYGKDRPTRDEFRVMMLSQRIREARATRKKRSTA